MLNTQTSVPPALPAHESRSVAASAASSAASSVVASSSDVSSPPATPTKLATKARARLVDAPAGAAVPARSLSGGPRPANIDRNRATSPDAKLRDGDHHDPAAFIIIEPVPVASASAANETINLNDSVVDDYALCFTKPDRSNANTPQATPLYVPSASDRPGSRSPSNTGMRSGRQTPASVNNMPLSASVTGSPQLPKFPPSPPSMATDLNDGISDDLGYIDKRTDSPVWTATSSPPSASIDSVKSPLANPFNYHTVSSDPPIFALSSTIFTQSINHHYSTPLPDVEDIFPWLHGIHEDNFSQRAFLDPQRRFRQDIPANGQAIYAKDLQSHKNVPSEAHGLMLVKVTLDPRENAQSLSDRGTLIGSVTVDEILKRNPATERENEYQWLDNNENNTHIYHHRDENEIQGHKKNEGKENERKKPRQHEPMPSYSKIYSSEFLELDTRQGISLRNFQIQVTKFACISDIIIYCSGPHDEAYEPLMNVARLISQAQRTFKKTYSLVREYRTFVVFEDFAKLSALSPHIVTIPLDLDDVEYEEHRLRNWDSNLLYHERVEMAMMSSASLIGPNIWLGNTLDYGTYCEIESAHQDAVTHQKNVLEYLSEENLDYLKTRNWSTFIDCCDGDGYTSPELLDVYISQTIECLTRAVPSSIIPKIKIKAPASGTLNIQTLNENDIIYLLKVCKLIYFRSLCTEKQKWDDREVATSIPSGTLIFCNDGYTETSALALCYLMYSRKLSAPEAWLELHVNFRRPFFCFPTDCVMLSMLTNVLHRFSPLGLAADNFDYDKGITRAILHQLVTVPIDYEHTTITTNTKSAPVDQSWFRRDFDGSFPSRILPHVYLGSLVHAENLGMLKKLGIKRVLSVGEPTTWSANPNYYTGQMSSVLYIDHLQDDGVDLISDSLQQCLEFLEEGYQRGEITLVHCRVGVSRSATVCIAEVMKRLGVGLPRAYLFVRVRRLNVIIQPNLKLMFELVKWEEKSRKYGEGWLREVDWHIFCREIAIMNKAYIA